MMDTAYRGDVGNLSAEVQPAGFRLVLVARGSEIPNYKRSRERRGATS